MAKLPDQSKPALLASYVYLEPFLKSKHTYAYRDWALDSGAYTARSKGVEIDLGRYIELCLALMAEDPTLTEIFSLDVIGNHKATLKNTERMWEAGVPATPAFHIGEPESFLQHIAKTYPKIALGGMADLKGKAKYEWASQCFARVWPKPVHGFGAGTEELILGLPWHSTDASSWEAGPCRYGRWKKYGNLSYRGSTQNLRAEVEWHLDLERRARERWARQMDLLGPWGDGDCNAIRLAVAMIEEKMYPERCRLAFGGTDDRPNDLPARLKAAGLFFTAGRPGADSGRGGRRAAARRPG